MYVLVSALIVPHWVEIAASQGDPQNWLAQSSDVTTHRMLARNIPSTSNIILSQNLRVRERVPQKSPKKRAAAQQV